MSQYLVLLWRCGGESTLPAPLCSLSNTERFSFWLPVLLRSAEASRWPFSARRPLPLAALSRGLKAIGSRFLRSASSVFCAFELRPASLSAGRFFLGPSSFLASA